MADFNYQRLARCLLFIGWIGFDSLILAIIFSAPSGGFRNLEDFTILVPTITLLLFLLHGLYCAIAGHPPYSPTSKFARFFDSTCGLIVGLVALITWTEPLIFLTGALLLGFGMGTLDSGNPPWWLLVLDLVVVVLYFSLLAYLVRCLVSWLRALFFGRREGRIRLAEEMESGVVAELFLEEREPDIYIVDE